MGDKEIFRENALAILRDAVGDAAAEFKGGQWEAIELITNVSSRALVVQMTGWGKSMVYFIATRHFRNQGKGPTLVISPLLALMRNQITSAEKIGLTAVSLNSSLIMTGFEVFLAHTFNSLLMPNIVWGAA